VGVGEQKPWFARLGSLWELQAGDQKNHNPDFVYPLFRSIIHNLETKMKYDFLWLTVASCGVLLTLACGDDDSSDGDGGDAAADSDIDTDSDMDTDSDIDGGCACINNGDFCAGYPVQCDWDAGKVVTNRSFSAVLGSGGEVATLDMCEVFNNRDKVKSLVFALGQQG